MAEINGTEIAAVPDEMDSQDILGWVVHYTVGRDFVVPRDWTEQVAEEVGLPSYLTPSEKSRKIAFKRAAKDRVPYLLNQERYVGDSIEFESEKVNNNLVNIDVKDRRDGVSNLDGQTIIRIGWDSENEKVTFNLRDEAERVAVMNGWVDDVREVFYEEYGRLQDGNLARDFSNKIRQWRKSTAGVKMRQAGGVYLLPKRYAPDLDALQQFLRRMNEEVKETDFECGLDMVEVIDSEAKQDMMERKVRKEIRTEISGALDKAFKQLDAETAVDEAISAAGSKLARADDVAVEHNALLDAKISLREELEEWKRNIGQEKEQELVEAAIESLDD